MHMTMVQKDIHTVHICAMMSWLFRGLIIFCPLSVIYYMVHRLASVYFFHTASITFETHYHETELCYNMRLSSYFWMLYFLFYICFIFDVGRTTKKLLVSKSSGNHTLCIWGQNSSDGKVSKPAQGKKPNCLMCETAWCRWTIPLAMRPFHFFPLFHWRRMKCGHLHKQWADSNSIMIKMLEIETNHSICAHGLA